MSNPNIRFDMTGRVWIDDVEIPNTGIRFSKAVDELAVLEVSVPVFDLTTTGEATVAFVASLDSPLIYGDGKSIPAALRALAAKIEALEAER